MPSNPATTNTRDVLSEITKMIIGLRVFDSTMTTLKTTFQSFRSNLITVGGGSGFQGLKKSIGDYFTTYKKNLWETAQMKNIFAPQSFGKYSKSEKNYLNVLRNSGAINFPGLWSTVKPSTWGQQLVDNPTYMPLGSRIKSGMKSFFGPSTDELSYGSRYSGLNMFNQPTGWKGTLSKTKDIAGDYLVGMGSKIAKPVVGIAGAMGKLATLPFQAVGKMATGMGTMVGRMIGLKPAQMNAIGSALGGVMSSLGGMGMMALVQLLMQLLDALNPFKDLMQALTDIFGVYGAILSTAFIPLIQKLFDVMLSPAVLTMITLIADAFAGIVTAFLPLIDILSPFGTLLLTAFLVPLQLLTPAIQLLGALLIPAATAMEGLNAALQGGVAGIGTWWQTYIIGPITTTMQAGMTGISQWWADNVTTPLTNALNGAAGMGKTIGNFFIGILNAIIGAFNAPIASINSFLTSVGSKTQLPTTPTVPYLAKGGIVTQPTLAVIGEAGPEKVVPLKDGENVGVTVIINGNVYQDQLDRAIQEAFIKKAMGMR